MHDKIKHDASDFYNDISENYDEMFNFNNDLSSANAVVIDLKEQFNFEKALDIGCGTGSFTLALAQNGAKATGIDLSTLMIKKARENSLNYGLDINFVNSGMTDMLANIDDKFDLIMCMGNTLPHLLSKKNLFSMLNACRELLNPGGHLMLNLLDYDKILSKQERIVGITKSKKHEFIRFYDFEEPYVNFNLLEINWQNTPPTHKISSTRLYPYKSAELKSALKENGFINFIKDNPENSKSIFITTTRK